MTKISNPGASQLPSAAGEPVAAPAAASKAQAQQPQQAQVLPTGITAVKSDDAGLSVALSADKLLAQTGLNINLSVTDKAYLETLSSSQAENLSAVSTSFTATVGASVGTAGQAAGSTGAKVSPLQGALQDRWSAFVTDVKGRGGPVDINALVQSVLRESYQETTKDLYFYAEKVKFFNNVKKEIRDELTRAREALAKAAGKDDTHELDPPFFPNPPNTEFTGGTEVTTDPEVAAAREALAAAQSQLQAQTSGNGVRMLTAAEKAKLDPPANGDVFVTLDADGEPLYRVDYKGTEVKIYEPADDAGKSKLITRIWGDPHVDETGDGGGDNWHFGNDSTFVLPDGTKISLNTEETSPGNGIFVTKGLDILSGDQHAQAGLGFDGANRTAGVAKDRHEFDVANVDKKGGDGGVFALQGSGQWAVMGNDGQFYDIKDVSWNDYKADKRVVSEGGAVSVTAAQATASKDHLSSFLSNYDAARGNAEAHDMCTTKADLDNYITEMEEKLSSVGDDAQLANVDLQNMLQKQQQTMQMMSNIAKMLHDTAMAIVRKIGG